MKKGRWIADREKAKENIEERFSRCNGMPILNDNHFRKAERNRMFPETLSKAFDKEDIVLVNLRIENGDLSLSILERGETRWLTIGQCLFRGRVIIKLNDLSYHEVLEECYSALNTGISGTKNYLDFSDFIHDLSVLVFGKLLNAELTRFEPNVLKTTDVYMEKHVRADSMDGHSGSGDRNMRIYADATTTVNVPNKMRKMKGTHQIAFRDTDAALCALDKYAIVLGHSRMLRAMLDLSLKTDTSDHGIFNWTKNKQINCIKDSTNDPIFKSKLDVRYDNNKVREFFQRASNEVMEQHYLAARKALALMYDEELCKDSKVTEDIIGPYQINKNSNEMEDLRKREDAGNEKDKKERMNMKECKQSLESLLKTYVEKSKWTLIPDHGGCSNIPENKIFKSPDLCEAIGDIEYKLSKVIRQLNKVEYFEFNIEIPDRVNKTPIKTKVSKVELEPIFIDLIKREAVQFQIKNSKALDANRMYSQSGELYKSLSAWYKSSFIRLNVVEEHEVFKLIPFCFLEDLSEIRDYVFSACSKKGNLAFDKFITIMNTYNSMRTYKTTKAENNQEKQEFLYREMKDKLFSSKKGGIYSKINNKLVDIDENEIGHSEIFRRAYIYDKFTIDNFTDPNIKEAVAARMERLEEYNYTRASAEDLSKIEVDEFCFEATNRFVKEDSFRHRGGMVPDHDHIRTCISLDNIPAIYELAKSRLYTDSRFVAKIALNIAEQRNYKKPFMISHPCKGGQYDKVKALVLVKGQIMKPDAGAAYITYLYDMRPYRSEKWSNSDIISNSVVHHKVATCIILNIGDKVLATKTAKNSISEGEGLTDEDFIDAKILCMSDDFAKEPSDYFPLNKYSDSLCKEVGADTYRDLDRLVDLHNTILIESSWGTSKFLKPFRYFAFGIYMSSPTIKKTLNKLIESINDSNKNKISIWLLMNILHGRKKRVTPMKTLLTNQNFTSLGNELFLINLCPYRITGKYSHLSECYKETSEEIELFNTHLEEHHRLIYMDFVRILEDIDSGLLVLGSMQMVLRYREHLTKIQIFSKGSSNRFSWSPASIVLIQGQVSKAGEKIIKNYGLKHSKLSLQGLSTAKSSISMETMESSMALETIIDYSSRLKCVSLLEILATILAPQYSHIECTMKMFPKDQVGGEREISIMTAEMRCCQAVCEDFARRVSELCLKNEVLDERDKKNRLLSNMMSVFKRGNRGFLTMDQTRWGPNFNTVLFSYMLSSFERYTTEAYIPALIANLSEFKVFMVDYEHIYDFCKSDSGFSRVGMLARSHMGQGLFHFNSSIYHAMLMTEILDIQKEICTKKLETVDAMSLFGKIGVETETLITSDDVYASFFIKSDHIRPVEDTESLYGCQLRRYRRLMTHMMSNMQYLLTVFGIKTSDYKNLISANVAEFNSTYVSTSGLAHTNLKFASSLTNPAVIGNIYDDIQNAYDIFYNAINSGCTARGAHVIAYINLARAMRQWKLDPSTMKFPSRSSITGGFPRMVIPGLQDIDSLERDETKLIKAPRSSFKNYLNKTTRQISDRAFQKSKLVNTIQGKVFSSRIKAANQSRSRESHVSILTYSPSREYVPVKKQPDDVEQFTGIVFFARAFRSVNTIKTELAGEDASFLSTNYQKREASGEIFIRKVLRYSDSAPMTVEDLATSVYSKPEKLEKGWNISDFILHCMSKRSRMGVTIKEELLKQLRSKGKFEETIEDLMDLVASCQQYKTRCVEYVLHPDINVSQSLTSRLRTISYQTISFYDKKLLEVGRRNFDLFRPDKLLWGRECKYSKILTKKYFIDKQSLDVREEKARIRRSESDADADLIRVRIEPNLELELEQLAMTHVKYRDMIDLIESDGYYSKSHMTIKKVLNLEEPPQDIRSTADSIIARLSTMPAVPESDVTEANIAIPGNWDMDEDAFDSDDDLGDQDEEFCLEEEDIVRDEPETVRAVDVSYDDDRRFDIFRDMRDRYRFTIEEEPAREGMLSNTIQKVPMPENYKMFSHTHFKRRFCMYMALYNWYREGIICLPGDTRRLGAVLREDGESMEFVEFSIRITQRGFITADSNLPRKFYDVIREYSDQGVSMRDHEIGSGIIQKLIENRMDLETLSIREIGYLLMSEHMSELLETGVAALGDTDKYNLFEVMSTGAWEISPRGLKYVDGKLVE
nr:MAG: L protein [Bat faecal associated bunyavirus 7]